MENKYYPPEIEEFHEGFSHEYKGPLDTKWHKEDFKLKGPNANFSWFLTEGHFRVKFLDREDIESLGFTHKGRTIDDLYELVVDRPAIMSAYTNRRYVIQHDFRTRQGVVVKAYDYSSGDTGEHDIYRGGCKNKSELKVLLKQLGI